MKNQRENLKNQEISVLTINIDICEEVNKDLAIKALISCLISVGIIVINELLKNAIAQSNFATRFDWLIDLSAFLAVLYAVISIKLRLATEK